MELTPEQNKAVESSARYLRIIAPPGSGKTSTIVARIEHLIRVRRISPFHICAVSFTRSAATEMKKRLEGRLKGSGHRASKMFVGTSHSLCVKILRQWGSLIGFDENFTIYDEIDQRDIIKDICSALKLKAKVEDVVMAISNRLQELPDGDPRENADIVAGEYLTRLRENNAFDYDLLLLYAIKLLKERQEVRAYYHGLYQHMIYDEFQDIAGEEYALIRLIDPENLTVVGDPNQELYAFRGTSNQFLLNMLMATYADLETVVLTKNFRSKTLIIEAANRLIRNNPGQLSRDVMEADTAEEGTVRTWTWDDKEQEADFIATVIGSFLKGESAEAGIPGTKDFKKPLPDSRPSLKPIDIAILFRTNRQAEKIAEALEKEKIPYQVINAALKFYQIPEVKRFIRHLQVIHNLKDNYAMRSILSDRLSKLELSRLESKRIENDLTFYEACSSHEPTGPDALTFFLTSIRLKIKNGSLVTVLEIAEELENGLHFARQYAAEGRLTKAENIQKLFVYLKDWQEQFPDDHTLSAFVEWYGMKTAEDLVKKDLDAVQLMTVHQSKGREFPVIFLAGVCENLLPLKSGVLEEERRICFVAVTRAKDELYILSPLRNYGKPVDRSRFIGEMIG